MGLIMRIAGLVFFIVLVVLGIVFVPDELMERVDRGANVAREFVSGEVSRRGPQVIEDVSQQARETKSDAADLYQSLKEKYMPVVSGWIANFFTAKK